MVCVLCLLPALLGESGSALHRKRADGKYGNTPMRHESAVRIPRFVERIETRFSD